MWFYARNGQSEVWVLQGEAGCSPYRGSLQGEMMRPRAILTWWEDQVPSMVRCKGWAILSWWEDWFLPCQIWVLSHSDVTVGFVPTWLDISVECHSLGESRYLVSYQESSAWGWGPLWCDCRIGSHMIICKCNAFPQMIVGVSYHAGGCEWWPFHRW